MSFDGYLLIFSSAFFIAVTPLVVDFMRCRRNRFILADTRAELYRMGWTRLERRPDGEELWGRELTAVERRMCADDRFVIPAKPGPLTLEGLERDLQRLKDRVEPTGIIEVDGLLSREEADALRAKFLSAQGQRPQFGAENIKRGDETADQDSEKGGT